MSGSAPNAICVHGRSEPVLGEILVHGRRYLLLEKLSHRGAFRIYDPHAGPGGDYRVLYRIPFSPATAQRVRTLSRLSGPSAHANFPTITDNALQGRDLMVVMSWVPGTSLRTLLRDVRSGAAPRPSVPAVCRLIRGLAHGLAQYHRIANLVHGDISPANLILTPRTTRLVLVDFGSAWPVECSANKVNGDGVTFPYAAPERIAGHALEDFRSDHFSLCVVWYELLTMEIPLDGAGGKAGLPENIKAHATTLVLPSKKIASRRRLPARAIQLLDETLRVGLALHPDERFSTTRDWLDAVDRLHYLLRPGGEISGSGLWALAGFDWLQRSLHGLFCRK